MADSTTSTVNDPSGNTQTTVESTSEPSLQTTGSSSDTAEGDSTGESPTTCRQLLDEASCHSFNNPENNFETCRWVQMVVWDPQSPCPDLAAGVGTCIYQDFTNDCSENPWCVPHRIFSRLQPDDTYEVFAHPQPCGTPGEYDMCYGGMYDPPVCECFGCNPP